MSANQLKSGDLIVRTTSTGETQSLRQHSEDWAGLIGNGATVRVPTYGVLAYAIRTSTMDMDKLEENRDEILLENRPFIPRAEIKYIGWLTSNGPGKSASSVIIKFARPEDANKIIDEGLVWQGELCQCELYEKQYRLKQCFNCQNYGHIGTQCKATTACGYCAQEHNSRDCPSKAGRTGTRRCATCQGEHEAWSQQCPARKDELTRKRATYATGPLYHPVPIMASPGTSPSGAMTSLRRKRSVRDLGQQSEGRAIGGATQDGQGRKWTNTGALSGTADKENEAPNGTSCQRPHRTLHPTRKALESFQSNIIARNSSQHMDVDEETDS